MKERKPFTEQQQPGRCNGPATSERNGTMATATMTRNETMVQTLTRLADKARKEGVRLQHNALTGEYYATSGTQDGIRYHVTAYSCECKGFERFGYCKHVGALATALGLIARPEETPVTVPACTACEGRGFHIKARKVGRGQYVREDVPCPVCHGAAPVRKAA